MFLPTRHLLFCCAVLFALVFAETARSQTVVIAEFLADNQVNTAVDEDADHSDWIELWNSGSSPVSLTGWYLTDDPNDLRKWKFPSPTPAVTLAAGARLIVWASNKDRKLAINKLHTNFRLSKSANSFLALVQADGLTIAHSYTYPQQVQDIAYGLISGGTATYLTAATPGSANSGARTTIGPGISQTTDQPPRPTGNATSAPIVVSTRITPTLRPLNASNPVQLKYRVMQGAELSAVGGMLDNGIAPDAIAGDGIYTGSIPTINVGVAQMIRWRVEAKDSSTNISTDPPYLDPTDNDQYFGTVTQDGITTSQLPILHWFVADAAASRTEAGTRCSLFFLDRFYDNVFVGLHGQSSSGFPVNKKSHDFNFSEDNRFKWKAGEIRQRAINLITTYADKSKVRDTLAWETWRNSGHRASHWSQLVRVQQNGGFWGIYDMVENGDEDFLERSGLDPLGALYKVYDAMVSAGSPTEKKTGSNQTDFSDLNTLYTNLEYTTNNGRTVVPLATRRRYGYDNVDLPSLVNSIAVNALINNNDQGHKNFYLYHDVNGNLEWSLLPWDEDLTWGHTWASGPGYFDDEIDSQRAIRNGATNMIKQLCYDSPEINAMLVRRMRTLMDTFLVSQSATDGPLEQRIAQLLNSVDPHNDSPATGVDDADLDMRLWGFWVHSSGTSISYTDSRMPAHSARAMAARILNSNPNNNTLTYNQYPALFPAAAPQFTDTRLPYLTGRRSYLYGGSALSGSLGIPAAQPAIPTGLSIVQVESNPASGNQEQEFFVIKNSSANYIDVSGWKITGAVDFTFSGGTVIPPFTTGTDNIGLLHVVRNAKAFRQRTTGATGLQYRLVVGPYSGQLSARGEAINLVIPGATSAQDVTVATTTAAAAATPAQNFLRVTELSYNPTPPTAGELAALPGVQASDFEYIELINTGASALNIGGATFDKGVTFTFPAGFTLQAGQRCVIVSLLAAYNLRYGAAGALVAGQYEGNLSNSGETIQLLDAVGESVLQFDYDPLWFGVPKPGDPATSIPPVGYSLVTRTSTPAYTGYGDATTWALADSAGGTPGTGDSNFANVFEGWRKAYFSPAEENLASLSAPAADADGDGRSNLEEFAFGGNPRLIENKPLPAISIINDNGTNHLAITFQRRHNALDTTYVVEGCGGLTSWKPVNLPVGLPIDMGNGLERVTYRDYAPMGSGQRYLRVRATR